MINFEEISRNEVNQAVGRQKEVFLRDESLSKEVEQTDFGLSCNEASHGFGGAHEGRHDGQVEGNSRVLFLLSHMIQQVQTLQSPH